MGRAVAAGPRNKIPVIVHNADNATVSVLVNDLLADLGDRQPLGHRHQGAATVAPAVPNVPTITEFVQILYPPLPHHWNNLLCAGPVAGS